MLQPCDLKGKRQEKAELGKGKGKDPLVLYPREFPRAPKPPRSPRSTHSHLEPRSDHPTGVPHHLDIEPLGYSKSKPCTSHIIHYYKVGSIYPWPL